MSASNLLEFLRRELAPTPGRGSATFRLTLACLAATIPILTHHIPHGLIVMIVMYLITQEDTVATLIGSILGVIGVTIGLGAALLAWEISLDIEWLRIVFFIVFFFGGLFLKRVLTIGALGSAIGVPASLVMILPDIYPPDPELLVEFVLWIWWCVTLGLSVNLGVQLLLSRGDPLTLLQRELATRLDTVAQTLRRLAGERVAVPERDSLRSLAIAGMSRPLALLKTAATIHVWARERHEGLSALITLTDRLVTSAVALETLPDLPQEPLLHERLLNVADGCDRMRRAFNELRLPDDWVALADEKNAPPPFPLLDIERTLDQIALAVPRYSEELSHSGAAPAEKRSLFLPDAFDNPEYVRFAIKGTLAALYLLRCLHRLRLSGHLHLCYHLLRRSVVDHRRQQPERDPPLRRRCRRRRDGSNRPGLSVSQHRDDRRVLACLRRRHRGRRLGELRHSAHLLRRLSDRPRFLQSRSCRTLARLSAPPSSAIV